MLSDGDSMLENDGQLLSMMVAHPAAITVAVRWWTVTGYIIGFIAGLISRPDFRFVFNVMHAVTGAYAKPIFVDMLGASLECII
ncbi:hypothetical protein DM860_009396 [Cuscuta australis]|uniref:Uncharacterized protein n=1 Tax=Cuscuta australis TaxID=267555 RepID=A0A328DFB8_9ASTE|nr:hypothetical protein DM860_009396 [Cuscuta australis]